MRILHFYPGRFPVTMYGGTPRITQWLAREQIKMGHQVYLMALEGSRMAGAEVIGFSEKASFEELDRLIPSEVEVVHAWTYSHKHDFKKPFLISYDRLGYTGEFHPNTVFASRRHAEIHGSKSFIHYGVAAEEYPYLEKKDDHMIFLALAAWPVKNLEGAIRVAKETNTELVIAGGYRLSLDKRIKSMGVLGDKNKRRWLSRAKALLFPVIWDEPFGIVMIEALACGTPIIGTPFGSLPEVIRPGTGFVCKSHQELVDAVRNIRQIPPKDCLASVQNYFNIRRMADQYFELYKKVAQNGYFDPANRPRLASKTPPGDNLRYYEGYRRPNWLAREFGPFINYRYSRIREILRIYENDEIPGRDLSN